MRRSRQLTASERWELGLFLTMLVVICLCVTAILNPAGFPHLVAFASNGSSNLYSDQAPHNPSAFSPSPQFAPAASAPTPNTINDVHPAVPSVSVAPGISPMPQPARKATDVIWFGGKEYRYAKTLRLRVTAYAPDKRCCWPYPGTTTASGLSVKTNHGRLVAADPRVIPMHALVSVPGYQGATAVPVLDRGEAITGHRLDVLLPTYDQAKEWGTKILDVKIYLPIDK